MNRDVQIAVQELVNAFPDAQVIVVEDGSGGAYVTLDPLDLGERFTPRNVWVGGHISAFYPAADIYPIFMDAAVSRVDGQPFDAPITPNANFQGRPAWQISRRNNQIGTTAQTAVSKVLKVRHFLETLP